MSKDPSENRVTFFAQTDFRDHRKVFGIRQADRQAHMYLIGKTGTGKSTLLETMISQDVRGGQGLALLDPHGDLAERVLARVPEQRKDDLIYFNVPDVSRPLAASGVFEVFKKIWADTWGPRMEHLLRNALLALLDQPEATLADVLWLLSDKAYRRTAMAHVASARVRDFWLREYESYPLRFRIEAVAPIQNKVGAFLVDPVLNGILAQPKSAFDLRRVMDDGKIMLVNLAKGKIGENAAALLGALLVSKMGLAALSRADVPEERRRDFFVYLDEFQNFTTLSLAGMLPELRKYRAGLVLAHQYLTQLDPQIRDAILGNVGTIIAFRLGLPDAEILGKEFYPEISVEDLISLPNYHIYLKMMIDGTVSRPFSAETLRALDSFSGTGVFT